MPGPLGGLLKIYRRALLLLSLPVLASPANAQSPDGGTTRDLQVTAGPTTAEYQHDWRGHRYIRIRDSKSGAELLSRSSPGLTTLWLTPDGQYLVGLSQNTYENNAQVVVVSRDGQFVHEERVRCSDRRLAGFNCPPTSEYLLYWYNVENPGLELLTEKGSPIALVLNASCERPYLPCPPRRLRLPLKSEADALATVLAAISEELKIPPGEIPLDLPIARLSRLITTRDDIVMRIIERVQDRLGVKIEARDLDDKIDSWDF